MTQVPSPRRQGPVPPRAVEQNPYAVPLSPAGGGNCAHPLAEEPLGGPQGGLEGRDDDLGGAAPLPLPSPGPSPGPAAAARGRGRRSAGRGALAVRTVRLEAVARGHPDAGREHGGGAVDEDQAVLGAGAGTVLAVAIVAIAAPRAFVFESPGRLAEGGRSERNGRARELVPAR